MLPLVVGAIGVVYGDIGTSPLYALRTAFTGQFGLSVSPARTRGSWLQPTSGVAPASG